MNSSGFDHSRQPGPSAEELNQIAHMLSGLRYGSVNVVVQDGVVVQIDRTEKHRVRSPISPGTNPGGNQAAERLRPLR